MLAEKPNILFYASNGNTFAEIFPPLIREMENLCHAHVLVADFQLSETTKNELMDLKGNNTIREFHIIRPHRERKEKARTYYLRQMILSKSLSKLDVDMVVFLGGDFEVVPRYILEVFKNRKMKKVVLQAGICRRILETYRRNSGLDDDQAAGSFLLLKSLRGQLRKAKMNFWLWKHYYFFPFFFQRRWFPLTGYEHLAFATGLSETVICYDPLMKEALTEVVPSLKQIYVARHPINFFSQAEAKEMSKRKGRLLVLFSGNLSTEMLQEKIDRWGDVAEQIVRLGGIREIHLRFHPRNAPWLQWPGVMVKEMEKRDCAVAVVDTKKMSLYQSLHLYDGILGSPSNALRIARAADRSLFIIGLPNCSDGGPNDQSWILGKGEGIQWIREGGFVTKDCLKPLPGEEENRSAVSSILLNLLQERSVSNVF